MWYQPDNNNLETLPPFLEAFLENPVKSQVSLFGNFFNCKRLKPYRWLLAKKKQYRERVWGGRCANSGLALLDLQLYEPKCAWNEDAKELTCSDVNSLDFDIRLEVNYLEEEEVHLKEVQLLLVRNCTSLETISSNVFGAGTSSSVVKEVHLEDLPSLTTLAPDAFGTGLQKVTLTGVHQVPLGQMLSLVKRQPHLEELRITVRRNSPLESVPRKAFTSVNSALQRVEFNGPKLLSIGAECVLELTSLVYLSFSGLAISELEPGAFDLLPSTSTPLEINLTSCSLDETKLLAQPFRNAQRPLNIALGRNSIHLLLEESFSFLLSSSSSSQVHHHQVHLEGNPISCGSGAPNSNETSSSHHHYWLYVHRERLREQIVGARCEEGDVDFFEHLEVQFGGSSGGQNSKFRSFFSVVQDITALLLLLASSVWIMC